MSFVGLPCSNIASVSSHERIPLIASSTCTFCQPRQFAIRSVSSTLLPRRYAARNPAMAESPEPVALARWGA
jgi:hypothetical protein